MTTLRFVAAGCVLAAWTAGFTACGGDASFGSIPEVGARVRVMVPRLGPGWRVGMFNRTRQEPPCYLVQLFDPGLIRRVSVTVPVQAVTKLQVSRLYPGAQQSPDPGAAAFDGEKWVDTPLALAQATGLGCETSPRQE